MSPRLPDFLAQPFSPIQFAIQPYVPLGGITFLYGKTRVGKSPLTWEMGRCVAAGEPFLGLYPVTQGRVLYCDLDTAPALVQTRLALIDSPPADFFIEFPGVRNLMQAATQDYFKKLYAEVQPTFVILNTLRKLYSGDEKDASLPSRIYAILLTLFPSAAVMVVHHDKKSSGNPEDTSDPDEAFSGHMAWLNDCQVGLHLTPAGGHVPGLLRLWHSKSQVSAEEPPHTLQLSQNGTQLALYTAQKATAVMSVYVQCPIGMSKTDKVRLISQQLGFSERSVWTYLSRLPDETLQALQSETPIICKEELQ